MSAMTLLSAIIVLSGFFFSTVVVGGGFDGCRILNTSSGSHEEVFSEHVFPQFPSYVLGAFFIRKTARSWNVQYPLFVRIWCSLV